MRRAIAGLLFALGTAPLAAGAADITLSFGDAPGGVASGFRIERREADAKRFEALALVGPGVPEFVDRGLPGGTRYCYRVRALAAQGEPAWSPEVCTVAEDEPAAAPGPASETAAAEAGAAEPAAAEAAPAEPAATEPEREAAAVAETAEPASAEAETAETAPAQASAGEPSVAAPAPGGPSEPRRIRASGGWLQVLD